MPRTPKKPPTKRSSYRITLDPRVVRNLRIAAADETLAAGRSVSWLDLLRRAAEKATQVVGEDAK